MTAEGIKRALAYVTSAYSSYSGCRQYREDIQKAREQVGPEAPQVDKMRVFYNHPGFIEANAAQVQKALLEIDEDRRSAAKLLFTAHSIPLSMAEYCDYQQQLLETARLVAERLRHARWELVYQSRSGPPRQPWLEPDVCEAITRVQQAESVRDVVVAPIGFLSDHLEVLFDLDVEARGHAEELGMHFVRAATVGTHPRFVRMIRELIQERIAPDAPRLAVGKYGANHDVCPPGCCRYEIKRMHTG
jgi:ferrochelatase